MKKIFVPIITALSLLVTSPVWSAPDPFASYDKSTSGIRMTCYTDKGPRVFNWNGDTMYVDGTPLGSISDGTMIKKPGENLFKLSISFADMYLDFGRKTQTWTGLGTVVWQCR